MSTPSLSIARSAALMRVIEIIGIEGVSNCCSDLPPEGFGLLVHEDMPLPWAIAMARATGWQVTPRSLCPVSFPHDIFPATHLPAYHVTQRAAA